MKLDPRTKLLLVFCLSSLAVFIQSIVLLAIVLFVSMVLSKLFAGDYKYYRKLRKFIMIFIGIVLIQSFFSPEGEVILGIAGFSLLTSGGLIKGVLVILRMVVIIVSATIMISSSSREIIQGLIQWKIPYELAFMVSLATRFLPMLGEEARDVYTAIQLRGIAPEELPLKKRFRLYSYLLMPVLTGVVVRAREISTSMEMRAFRAYDKRSSYLKLQLCKRDYLVMTAALLFLLLISYLHFFKGL